MSRTEFMLFDLDNTLYPRSCGLFDEIDRRINLYLKEFVGIPEGEVDFRRRSYMEAHGTTLNGLMHHHGVEPDHYLDYVHDVDLGRYLDPDPDLRALIAALPGRKYIFSNASTGHCRRVLEKLGLDDLFSAVYDIDFFAYRPKPRPEIYHELLAEIGGNPRNGVMVDDMAVNLEPAAALGMRTFHYAPGGNGDRPSPGGRISSLAELLDLVE